MNSSPSLYFIDKTGRQCRYEDHQNEPSICIPRVFINITEKRIRAIFRELDLGNIRQVDMVKCEDHKNKNRHFWCVFVHFTRWYTKTRDGGPNINSITVRRMLIDGQRVKINYDTPWYWLISKKKIRVSQSENKNRRPLPSIDYTYKDPITDIANQKTYHQQPGDGTVGVNLNIDFIRSGRQFDKVPSSSAVAALLLDHSARMDIYKSNKEERLRNFVDHTSKAAARASVLTNGEQGYKRSQNSAPEENAPFIHSHAHKHGEGALAAWRLASLGRGPADSPRYSPECNPYKELAKL